MSITRPMTNLALIIFTSAFLTVSQQVFAENVEQLPATKHQAETLKGIDATDTTGSSPPAGGMPMTDHQSEALSTAPQPGTGGLRLLLSGSQEVPPVTTSATGTASITIGADKAVSGGISTAGIVGTAAHIHAAAAGTNGPVVITLEKDAENGWVVPADTSLTDAQHAMFNAGELYLNVHSTAHPAGEIRAQLKP